MSLLQQCEPAIAPFQAIATCSNNELEICPLLKQCVPTMTSVLSAATTVSDHEGLLVYMKN